MKNRKSEFNYGFLFYRLLTQEDYDSSYKMTQVLKGQAVDGMVLDQGYLDALLDIPNMEEISEEIVPVLQCYYDAPETHTAQPIDTALEPFHGLYQWNPHPGE